MHLANVACQRKEVRFLSEKAGCSVMDTVK
jgi:hypothetical protein